MAASLPTAARLAPAQPSASASASAFVTPRTPSAALPVAAPAAFLSLALVARSRHAPEAEASRGGAGGRPEGDDTAPRMRL
jgi:hypothetical protein